VTRWIEEIGSDIRYTLRHMRAAPSFAAIAIATLALGIGASVAIFSIVRAVLLRPLPYEDADRLVHIVQRPGAGVTSAASAAGRAPAGAPAALDASQLAAFRAHTRTLKYAVAYGITTATLTGRGEPIRLDGAQVSPHTFAMLGTPPLIGRTFAGDMETTSTSVVVLSHAAWRRRFGGDPAIVGKTLTLDGRPRPILGVMPARFAFPDAAIEFWTPYEAPATTAGLRPPRIPVIARLQDGVSLLAAEREVNAILVALGAHGVRPPPGGATTMAAAAPAAEREPRFALVSLEDQLVAPVRPALLVLMAAVGLLLAIVCVNVANLLLSRTAARQRELATRLALGASRRRLLRQLLTECLCLALCGGVAGAALAVGGVEALRALGATIARRDLSATLSLPRLDEVGIDGVVLAFALLVSTVTGVIVGLAPALGWSRAQPIDMLRQPTGAGVWRRSRMPRTLVAVEIGMAMLLSIGGGLLARSFVRLSQTNPGYTTTNVLSFVVTLPADRDLAAFAERLVERVRTIPGVRAAGYTRHLPMVRW
jgi:putative ABC transport system permease protein